MYLCRLLQMPSRIFLTLTPIIGTATIREQCSHVQSTEAREQMTCPVEAERTAPKKTLTGGSVT